MKLMIDAFPAKSDPTFGQCPRCRNYLRLSEGQDNYDNLCDRCCRVLINCFPEHSSVYNILKYARTKSGQSLDGLEDFIEKLKQLKANGLNNDVFDPTFD